MEAWRGQQAPGGHTATPAQPRVDTQGLVRALAQLCSAGGPHPATPWPWEMGQALHPLPSRTALRGQLQLFPLGLLSEPQPLCEAAD